MTGSHIHSGKGLEADAYSLVCQITAAARCKQSKWVFLLTSLCGCKWKERELFYSPDEVRPHHHGLCLQACTSASHTLDPEAVSICLNELSPEATEKGVLNPGS